MLRERLKELARIRRRFGYRRLHVFLRREGHWSRGKVGDGPCDGARLDSRITPAIRHFLIGYSIGSPATFPREAGQVCGK